MAVKKERKTLNWDVNQANSFIDELKARIPNLMIKKIKTKLNRNDQK